MSDVELRRQFEETTTRNVKACVGHANDTRDIVRELETKVEKLQLQVLQYDNKFAQINKDMAGIRAKVFSGGTTQ